MLNVATFVGRIATELRIAPSGNVADFVLAVDRDRKGPNGEKLTDFFTLKIFNGSIAPFQKYTEVGDLVSFKGSAEQDTWVDKEGNKRSRVVFPGNISFLPNGRKATGDPVDRAAEMAIEAVAAAGADEEPVLAPMGVDDDELPW